jgi:hypothetical protein
MDLTLYPRLSTRSKRALTRKNSYWGKPYTYRPRGTLLLRLSRETGLTIDKVLSQLEREREYLIAQKYLT